MGILDFSIQKVNQTANLAPLKGKGQQHDKFNLTYIRLRGIILLALKSTIPTTGFDFSPH